MTGAISIATGKASTTYLKKAPVFRGFSVAINDRLVMEVVQTRALTPATPLYCNYGSHRHSIRCHQQS